MPLNIVMKIQVFACLVYYAFITHTNAYPRPKKNG